MSALDPARAEELATQRALARRARGQGRRWYLRALLMLMISAYALYRGGQLNVLVGGVLVLLALLSVSLGRNMRTSARAMEAKIKLMESA